MSDLILVLSECESSLIKYKTKEPYYRFHFKGFYLGEKVKEIFVRVEDSTVLEKGELYLLWVKRNSIQNGKLFATLIRQKKNPLVLLIL